MLNRIDRALSRLDIARRTLGGFSVVVVLMTALALASWWQLMAIEAGIVEAETTMQAEVALNEISMGLADLSDSSRRFLRSRNVADMAAARAASAEMRAALDQAIDRFAAVAIVRQQGPLIRKRLAAQFLALEWAARVTEYQSRFFDEFLATASPLANLFRALSDAAINLGTKEDASVLVDLSTKYYESRAAVARFAMTLQPNDLESAHQELDRFIIALAGYQPSGPAHVDQLFAAAAAKTPPYTAAAHGIFTAIQSRLKAGGEVIQATQRMEEVMGAVKEAFTTLRIQTTNAQLLKIKGLKHLFLLAATAAILLAVALTWLIGGSISRPVRRMTSAMRKLAAGNLMIQVPALDHQDEVGAMAAAVEVFRQSALKLDATQYQLKATTEQAKAANRAKSVFLANMSHEIRTPLNAILGFAQVLGRDPGMNKTQRDSLTTIQRSGEHLLTLINDILDMAKIEAGRMTLQTAPFDLAKLLTETEGLFQHRAHDRGLILTVEASGLPHRVDGDEMKLRQVLINLIGNAVKFTHAGSVTLRVEAVGTDRIRFSITDTGIGITPQELPRLFVPFTQTESGRSVQGGTGLGLALSSQFVRMMRGELTAESTIGRGSCFSFSVPLRAVETVKEPTSRRSAVPVIGLVPNQPVCRILIVDDLPDNRAPLLALLKGLNPQPPVLDFREAADGQEAVAIWEEWQPQVIFMDMRMPVLSGEEATRQIKARMVAQPAAVRSVIVALTASAFAINRDRFLACGCDEFARKPFVAEELFAILEQRAGLRFIRAAALPVNEDRLSLGALATQLAACPDEWRTHLKDAVRLGDFDRITELVEQLGDPDVALPAALARWAYDYDLEAFTILCNRAEGQGDPA
jgi:signal transduction histidine kinase/CheY-like chemotaxis protein